MINSRTAAVFGLCFFLVGCVTEDVGYYAAIVTPITAERAASCDAIGKPLTVSHKGSFKEADNIQGAVNDLKNQVHALGGNAYVTLDTEVTSKRNWTKMVAQPYRCDFKKN